MQCYWIPDELCRKHKALTLDECKEISGNTKEAYDSFYQGFLDHTDYICIKITEGDGSWDNYQDEKNARIYARSQL